MTCRRRSRPWEGRCPWRVWQCVQVLEPVHLRLRRWGPGVQGNVFIIEIGPLLTAALLAGRIGGSYAGELAVMRSSDQVSFGLP